MISVGVVALGSIPMMFLKSSHPSTIWVIYPLAAIQGVGIAIQLNTATSLISDVVGSDNTSSAFVYGVYGFFDRVSNGIILTILVAKYSEDGHALALILGLIPTISAGCAAILATIGEIYYAGRIAKLSKASAFKSKKPENQKL
jgi:MFS family permease